MPQSIRATILRLLLATVLGLGLRLWRIEREIEWTRDLAARLSARPNPPELSEELKQLDALEERLPDRRPDAPEVKTMLDLPAGVAARWSFDEREGRRIEDVSGNGVHGSVSGPLLAAPGIQGGGLLLGGGQCMTTGDRTAEVLAGNYTASVWLRSTAEVTRSSRA